MTEKVVLPIHGEDHCPGGPDPIPCLNMPYAWIKSEEPFTNSPTIRWKLFWRPDDAGLEYHTSNEAVFDFPLDGDEDEIALRVKQRGLYLAMAYVEFDSLNDTSQNILVSIGWNGSWFPHAGPPSPTYAEDWETGTTGLALQPHASVTALNYLMNTNDSEYGGNFEPAWVEVNVGWEQAGEDVTLNSLLIVRLTAADEVLPPEE